MQMSRPLLLGHRGARATRTIPENTIESFDLALAHGCDGFEFDMRRTADGRAVICHDPIQDGVEIANAGAGELTNLPTLEQVLRRYSGKAFLDIEVKVPGLEQTVLALLTHCPPQRGFVVSSFLSDVLAALAKIDEGLPLGLLCETPSQLKVWKDSPAQVLLPHFTQIDERLCATVHAAGKKIFAWTANDREAMRQLASWGVDGIISDHTEALVATLGHETLKPGEGQTSKP
jgi:glycerophosphoryl diester phosphodiesterase